MSATITTEELHAHLAAGNDQQLLELANNPATPADTLANLYRVAHHQRPLVEAIASNPNVSGADLWQHLAVNAPEQVVHNPAFKPAVEADPDIIANLWSEHTDSLLTVNTPPEVAALLVAHAEAFTFDHLTETAFTPEQFNAMLPAAKPAWRDSLEKNRHKPNT